MQVLQFLFYCATCLVSYIPHIFPSLLNTVGVDPAFSSGHSRWPVKCRDAPRNVVAPEILAALAGVFGSQSGDPSLCLSGSLLYEGWASSVLLNTPSMSFHWDRS